MTTSSKTMTSIVQDHYGSEPEAVLRLAEVAKPTAFEEGVLVRVRAASVDRGTWHVMAGLPYPVRLAGFGLRRPKHSNPGRSFAGTVEALGAGATGFDVGDAVFGVCASSFAEYAIVGTKKLALKPAELSFEQAAAVPISGLTALQAVRDHARVRRGEKVLIMGASGGVGSFAVQIAKIFEAEVTGVCSTPKVDLVRGLGADHVIDYTAGSATNSHRYDVILDTGGNRRLSDLRRALTPKGRLVIVGGETDGRWLGGADRQLRALVMSRFVGHELGTFVSSENAADLAVLGELLEAGKIAPVVDRIFSLDETAAAIRRMLDGHARGKVVISVPA